MNKAERNYKKKRLKEYRKLLMSNKFWDWDFTSILYVERLQMLRVAKAISTDIYRHEGWEEDVKWINLAVKILDLYLNDTWWSVVEGEVVIHPYVNTKNFYRFFRKDVDFSDDNLLLKQALYEEKLWYTYNMIKLNKLRQWWT